MQSNAELTAFFLGTQSETSQVSPKISELMTRRKEAVQTGDDIEGMRYRISFDLILIFKCLF